MRKTVIFFLLLFTVSAGPLQIHHLWANPAEESHAAGAGEHEESWGSIAGKWFNFFALVAILYLFLRKTIRVQDTFKTEAEEIRRSIEGARQAKAEAEQRLQEMDDKMAQVSQEIARIKAEAVQEAEAEKNRILDSARLEAKRIVEMAHRDIDSEVQRARKDLRKHVADLAVSQGREILQEEISEDDQKRMMDGYIESLGK